MDHLDVLQMHKRLLVRGEKMPNEKGNARTLTIWKTTDLICGSVRPVSRSGHGVSETMTSSHSHDSIPSKMSSSAPPAHTSIMTQSFFS